MKNIHEGHRKRFKEMLTRVRLCDLPEINQLEYILGFSIRRRDTNPIAHDLLDKFKSLYGVLHASVEELITVNYVGRQTANFLVSLSAINECVVKSSFGKSAKLTSIEKTLEYGMKKITNPTIETLLVLLVDSVGTLIDCLEYTSLQIDGIQTNFSQLVRDLQRRNAKYIVFIHNHPDGDVTPSRADIQFVTKTKDYLRQLNICLQDAFILGDESAYSQINNAQYFYDLMDIEIPIQFKFLQERNGGSL